MKKSLEKILNIEKIALNYRFKFEDILLWPLCRFEIFKYYNNKENMFYN